MQTNVMVINRGTHKSACITITEVCDDTERGILGMISVSYESEITSWDSNFHLNEH